MGVGCRHTSVPAPPAHPSAQLNAGPGPGPALRPVPASHFRVEAENNLDFRLGTGVLRGTRLARPGDVAAISRIGESSYELRLFRRERPMASRLAAHAVNFVGNRGKRYGFVSNDGFREATGIRFGRS